MDEQNFTGDMKQPMKSPLAKIERKIIDTNLHRFPPWLHGYQLTVMTIPWSVGLVVFGYLASRGSRHWLWLSTLMLFLQWFTDSFDGALGKFRDFGIPKWGYYMDHFLDFVFMAAIFVGYSFMLEAPSRRFLFLLIPIFGAYMTNAYLAFGATGEFKITYLGAGPTEMRVCFAILNTIIIFFGTKWIQPLLPWIVVLSILFLCVVVFRTQKHIWQIDMKDKAERGQQSQAQGE